MNAFSLKGSDWRDYFRIIKFQQSRGWQEDLFGINNISLLFNEKFSSKHSKSCIENTVESFCQMFASRLKNKTKQEIS